MGVKVVKERRKEEQKQKKEKMEKRKNEREEKRKIVLKLQKIKKKEENVEERKEKRERKHRKKKEKDGEGGERKKKRRTKTKEGEEREKKDRSKTPEDKKERRERRRKRREKAIAEKTKLIEEELADSGEEGAPPITVFGEKYGVGEVLGRGAFSVVKKVTSKRSGRVYAVKIIDKKNVGQDMNRLRIEIDILTKVKHPNIINLKEDEVKKKD